MLRMLVGRPFMSVIRIAPIVLMVCLLVPASALGIPSTSPIAGAAFAVSGASASNSGPASPQPAQRAAPTGGIGLRANYAHDWVCVSGAAPSTQLQITVRRGGSNVAALNAYTALDGSYCSYQHNDWLPSAPDIQVGDSVFAASGSVTAAVDPVGEIAGTLDVATSSVSGALHVPSLAPNSLKVVCEVWVDGASVSPIVLENVAADGGAYACDFGAKGFHVAPGDNIAVGYYEPDNDLVINVFRTPAPDPGIDMWSEGGGVAAAGGLALLHIRYQNNGTGPAADLVITDTLSANVAYVTGTAPVVPLITPGLVSWHLGSLSPGSAGHFFVVLTNTLGAGATLTNTVAIGTSSPGDDSGNNYRSIALPVVAGSPDARIDQNPNPEDPLPGDSYHIDVGYGNDSQIPVGPVKLHLQLPAGTTLQSWASQNGYGQLWTLASSTGNHLVFQAPALPGPFGDQLLVRAGISQTVGANVQITSTTWVEAAADGNLINNGPNSRSVWTGTEQRPDLSVRKRWGDGTLVAGGTAWYSIDYHNDGNLTQSSVRLTDTLPVGTSFVEASYDTSWSFSEPRPPAYQGSGVVVWNLGTLAPAEGSRIKVRLALDGVAAGDTITNTVNIAGLDHDRSWWNNHASEVEDINANGPNLRLRQESAWESPAQVRFELQFENIGTTIVNNVRITDTVPAGLEYAGNWSNQWWGDLGYSYDSATRQIVWYINKLEPNWAGSVIVRFVVPLVQRGHQGLKYTNVAGITLPAGDVRPASNSTSEVAFSGPELFVHQSMWSGALLPGNLVTFLVDFGNRNNGPWSTSDAGPGVAGVWITNTLPAGMSFVSATNPWSPGGPWMPRQDGSTLSWGMGGLCANCRLGFLVTTRISDTVRAGTDLTSVMEIGAVVPGDVDPIPGNNTSAWNGRVRGMTFLPMVRK
jgi:uncharacterized repeat protein (TIGR01451 family)